MARLVTIQGDAVWLPMMLQCLAKKCLRRQISITQLEAKIPAKAEENAVAFEPTSGK